MKLAVWNVACPTLPLIRISAAAVALSVVCLALRLKIIYYDIGGLASTLVSLSDVWRVSFQAMIITYFDMLVIWGVFSICFILIYFSKATRVSRATEYFYFGFAIVVVFVACINVLAIELIGGSLTYQWLYYADFFRSFTAQSAIRPALNASFFEMIGFAVIGWLLVYGISFGGLRSIYRGGFLAPLLLLTLPLMIGYFILFGARVNYSDIERARFTNPLLELASTAMTASAATLLNPEEAIAQRQLPNPVNNRNDLPVSLRPDSIRNVVLVVMESVGARYVADSVPARSTEWTPHIASYNSSTIVFKNFYSHVPNTNKSLISLLYSRYPSFSFDSEFPKLHHSKLPNLGSRLKGAGYRTSFFMSGDFEYQSLDKFLENKGFDLLSDMQNIPCKIPVYIGSSAEFPHLDAVDDSCTAEELIGWIDAKPHQPFFAIFWTGNTHWPYISTEPPAPGALAGDHHLNRYLGSLQSSDVAIGKVLDHLRQRGLLDSTLVVVTGDHGQAFGEHRFRVHGNSIYEEEIHIPLILISSQIMPEMKDTLGGMIDLAPTLLHILGLPLEPTWKGRSLFDPHRPERVFMFAPNQEMVAGYREGNHKFMYSVTRDRALVFDLANDPAEKFNISDNYSAKKIRRHLSGWLHQLNQ